MPLCPRGGALESPSAAVWQIAWNISCAAIRLAVHCLGAGGHVAGPSSPIPSSPVPSRPRLASFQPPQPGWPAVSVPGAVPVGPAGAAQGQLAPLCRRRLTPPLPVVAVDTCALKLEAAGEQRHENTRQIDEIDWAGSTALRAITAGRQPELCRRVWPRHQPNEVGRITTHSDRGARLYIGIMGRTGQDVTPSGRPAGRQSSAPGRQSSPDWNRVPGARRCDGRRLGLSMPQNGLSPQALALVI